MPCCLQAPAIGQNTRSFPICSRVSGRGCGNDQAAIRVRGRRGDWPGLWPAEQQPPGTAWRQPAATLPPNPVPHPLSNARSRYGADLDATSPKARHKEALPPLPPLCLRLVLTSQPEG